MWTWGVSNSDQGDVNGKVLSLEAGSRSGERLGLKLLLV